MYNHIDVEIENTSCINRLTFINNLNEGDPIPDIGVEQKDISVIYVFFPLGEGDAYLTTEALANDFVCYAPYNWNVEKAYDKDHYGMYFKLFPTAGYEFEPKEKMYFSIANIVTYGSLEKMVYVAVNFTSIFLEDSEVSQSGLESTKALESANGTDYLACIKKRMPLNVVSFEAVPAIVAVGDEINLNWTIVGDTTRCVLTPGDIEVQKTGSINTTVTSDTEFRIYALNGDTQVSKTAMVYIEIPKIKKFNCNAKDNRICFGECVSFEYEVENCNSVFMNQGIGRLYSNSFNVIPNLKSTDYTLSCRSPNGLIQKTITIEITDFLEVSQVVFFRTKKSDGNYQYTLSWVILNSTSCKIVTSDGITRSQDQEKGEIVFQDTTGMPLSVRFICSGKGGQKLDSEYTL